jgi:putative FmdB family regulatory protein
MPFFEFVCDQCQRAFEELVYGDEKACCPSCGSVEVRRVLSVFAVGRGKEATPSVPSSCSGCGSRGSGSCPMS